MTNEQLVALIKDDQDISLNMKQLYNQTKNFIYSIAWQYRHYAELEDLGQEGYLALYDAIKNYDPAANTLFLTYAKYWIKQRIIRYIQNNGVVRLPVYEWERVMKYKKFEKRFLSQIGRSPTNEEIECCLGFTFEQMTLIRKAIEMKCFDSLDRYVDDEEHTLLCETISGTVDVESSVLKDVEQEQLQAVLWPLVDSLPGKWSKVIRMYYQKGLTMKEIGRRTGNSLEAVRQYKDKALKELHKLSKTSELRSFWEERQESIAYHTGGVALYNCTWTSSTERAAIW